MKTLEDALAEITSSYPAAFLVLMGFVLSHEDVFQKGHYGDYDFVAVEHDPNDPGGTTKYGIDQADHPNVDVEDLTFADAVTVYYNEIWRPLRASELPTETAFVLCDSAINCGVPRAVRWLQALVGTTQDGNLGPATIAAVQDFVTSQSEDQTDTDLAFDLINRRERYYNTEVRQSLRDEYLKGWNNRLSDLHEAVAAAGDTAAT